MPGVSQLCGRLNTRLPNCCSKTLSPLTTLVQTASISLYKGKHALIPYEDRAEIVRSIKYVDAVVPQYDMDKLVACKKMGASILFVGDDWYGTEKWQNYEKEFAKEGITIIYFPYTKGVSSTKITNALKQVRGWTSDISEAAAKTHINGGNE